MKEVIQRLKTVLSGSWEGEGFARYPTIDDTAYTEQTEFTPDKDKDAIFYSQKTWYKNNTEKNGHTVFWDCGFIFLKEDRILLHSVQIGGRMEAYELTEYDRERFVFNTVSITEDPKATQSQRIFVPHADHIHYELNMATHAAEFQNHLVADLWKREVSQHSQISGHHFQNMPG